MRRTIALAGALTMVAQGLLGAQVTARSGTIRSSIFDDERLVIGISTGSGGARDTLGVLVASVTPGGPADKAGIEEGNRIAAINGVNLKLDPADVGEYEMSGVLTRRLTRELGKVKSGQEVDLRVWADGKYKSVKVKPIPAEDLPGNSSLVFRSSNNRGVLGMSLSASGSRRDTLGLMVIRVSEDGPAEKAGIVEGERIAGINSVDLRVASEDAGDSWASNARMNRFRREISRLKPDDEVELKIWGNGRTRTVKVKAIRPSDLPHEGGAAFFYGDGAIGEPFVRIPAPAIAPLPPRPMIAPRARILRFEDEGMRLRIEPRIELDLRATSEATRARAEEIRAQAQTMAREARERARTMSNQLQRQLRNRMLDLRWRLDDQDLDDDDGNEGIVARPVTPVAPPSTPAPSAVRVPAMTKIAPVETPAPAAPARKATSATSVRMTISM